jgi:hypothetical protein
MFTPALASLDATAASSPGRLWACNVRTGCVQKWYRPWVNALFSPAAGVAIIRTQQHSAFSETETASILTLARFRAVQSLARVPGLLSNPIQNSVAFAIV